MKGYKMNRKKLILSLLLCISMVILSACGNKNENPAPAGDNQNVEATQDESDRVEFDFPGAVIYAPGKYFDREEKDNNINGVECKDYIISDGEIELIMHRFEKSAFEKAGKPVPQNNKEFADMMIPAGANREVNSSDAILADYNNDETGLNYTYMVKQTDDAFGLAEVNKNPFNPFSSGEYCGYIQLK